MTWTNHQTSLACEMSCCCSDYLVYAVVHNIAHRHVASNVNSTGCFGDSFDHCIHCFLSVVVHDLLMTIRWHSHNCHCFLRQNCIFHMHSHDHSYLVVVSEIHIPIRISPRERHRGLEGRMIPWVLSAYLRIDFDTMWLISWRSTEIVPTLTRSY